MTENAESVRLFPLCRVCRQPVSDGDCYAGRNGYLHRRCVQIDGSESQP